MRFFDLHCDTLYEMATKNKDIYRNDLDVSIEKSLEYKPYIGCFAVWIPDNLRGEKAFEFFKRCARLLNDFEIKYKNKFKICRTVDDLKSITSLKNSGVLLTVEGSAVIAGNISNVEYLSKSGVKIMTLTWNGSCEAGDGIEINNSRGLTKFGKDLVKEMEKYSIIVDVSHASEKLFYDVCSIATKPFIATHSNSKTICDHKRNISDEQFKYIRDIGGIVGLNLCEYFLSNSKESGFESFLKHMEHFLSLDGENTISIGSDFDGATMPKDIYGLESIKKLYEYLLKKNYSESLLDKIFFSNAYNFVSKFFQ